ncbi:NAD(P)H-dependent flavin oxidoreductase YrpB (nitropropane dioxygenase family) [Wenyingzhuangia heitensis]|uniref:NAD(P)H-dependent flavin oxidoreductase YrpB (Nitropropane dioxygenase family) n=1 Tax=Wenyingzhuangia heitensis TaxID=1487859 RepID=A0ABX0UBG4_9FLAO|nr:NAD(P)H-dependent flavin oxidoreductase YrpB (nitropropane dioxygenase family) [Wenyingzhuangia heitensis]
MYQTNPSKETLQTFYDNAKLKTGIFEGDVEDGKLEIGQIAGLIKKVAPIATIMDEMITEYNAVKQNLN